MNHLVYKGEDPTGGLFPPGLGLPPQAPNMGNDANVSKILFKRLSNKGPISNSSKITLLESSRSKSSQQRTLIGMLQLSSSGSDLRMRRKDLGRS